MSAPLYCPRCGRELGTGLPSPCPSCAPPGAAQGLLGAFSCSPDESAGQRELAWGRASQPPALFSRRWWRLVRLIVRERLRP